MDLSRNLCSSDSVDVLADFGQASCRSCQRSPTRALDAVRENIKTLGLQESIKTCYVLLDLLVIARLNMVHVLQTKTNQPSCSIEIST